MARMAGSCSGRRPRKPQCRAMTRFRPSSVQVGDPVGMAGGSATSDINARPAVMVGRTLTDRKVIRARAGPVGLPQGLPGERRPDILCPAGHRRRTSMAEQTVYIVQQRHWQWKREDYVHDITQDEPVKAFRTRERAEAYRQDMERQHAAEQAALAEVETSGYGEPNVSLFEIVEVPFER